MSEGVDEGAQRTLEQWAADLLEATEAIHASLLDEASFPRLEAAQAQRAVCFEALRGAIEAGAEPDAAVRACVAHVRALDAEILAVGERLIETIRAERHALGRRRAVIHAHARRERPTPRAIAVKA